MADLHLRRRCDSKVGLSRVVGVNWPLEAKCQEMPTDKNNFKIARKATCWAAYYNILAQAHAPCHRSLL